MKKVYLITLVVLLSMVLCAGAVYGQTTPAGPRIVHEEQEIIVLEDGKEIEKYYAGKHGDQKMAIMKDARDKKRKTKVMDVQKPKLKFYDEGGKLVKEIDLSSTKSKGKIKETRPLYKKGEFDANMTTVKWPQVSKQSKYVLIDNTTFADAGYSVPLGKIVLYDVAGNMLFEKQFPHGMAIYGDLIGRMVVADNGTVAVITSEGEEEGGSRILYAYDKTGKELLVYPNEGEKAYIYEVLKISSNGRYLAVRVGFKSDRTVFFDLENNTSWKGDQDYNIAEISDAGIVKATYYDAIKQKSSGRVFIDLTEKR